MGRTKSLSTMLDDCSDSVFRIIIMPNTNNPAAYKTLLARVSEEDLKTALEILQKEDACISKQRDIEIELNLRNKPEPLLHKSAWEKAFAKEWEAVREASKRRRCK